MSLYEQKINETVDKLLPANDYINAITKAVLLNDLDQVEYLKVKIREANKRDNEMILRDFQFDIHGNYIAGNSSFPCDPILNENLDNSGAGEHMINKTIHFDNSGNKINDNSIDAKKE